VNLTTGTQCAYPGCDLPAAAPTSDRGARPKYCADDSHNPLTAHRERRRLQAEASGQRAEETGGQPVTAGLTRAGELIRTLEKLTTQHTDALTRAVTELRSAGDVESAEAEVYATRANADQHVAAAEARHAEELQRRRDAEADRDQACADREQADEAAAQALARMDELTAELTTLRAATAEEIRQLRTTTATEIEQARATAARETGQAREEADRLVADATSQLRRAEKETARAQQSEASAIQRADRAHAQAGEEISRVRADAERERDELHAATDARLAALEDARTAVRIRAERAEADLDAARAENHRLTEQLAQATADDDHAHVPGSTPTPRRARKTAATRKPPGAQA
jgi:DNA segregation ATPase FtsK/SpoIIIE-like protein